MNAAGTAGRDGRAMRPAMDAALAAAFAVVAVVGVWFELDGATGQVGWPAGAYLIAVAASAALLLRRRWPIGVGVAVVLLVGVYHWLGYPGSAPAVVVFAAVYFIAASEPPIASFVIGVALVILWLLVATLPPGDVPWYSWAYLGPAIGMLSLVALGSGAGHVRRLQARAFAAEQAGLRERMTQERLEMARELHDVLAHTVAAITVQSGVALDAFDDDPGMAREAMARVRTLAKQAIPELRRTLQLLRDDARPGEAIAPQPSLAQLDALIAGARGAGLRVDADIALGLPEPSPFMQLTAYRIVQEALTNVIRHAGATTVTLNVRQVGDRLAITVTDDGRGAAGSSAPEPGSVVPGLGLLGMRERTEAAGGSLTAGPRPDGGFTVAAELPVEAA